MKEVGISQGVVTFFRCGAQVYNHSCKMSSGFFISIIIKIGSLFTELLAWRKGLRRILSLPYNTHSRLISPVCDFLPVREELICRCVSFIMKCLNSCNSVVHSVSRIGIYGTMRMLSPIGANVQFCCNYYGMSPNCIPNVNKRLAWTVLWNSVIVPDLEKINLIKELLSVKFHKGQISL